MGSKISTIFCNLTIFYVYFLEREYWDVLEGLCELWSQRTGFIPGTSEAKEFKQGFGSVTF